MLTPAECVYAMVLLFSEPIQGAFNVPDHLLLDSVYVLLCTFQYPVTKILCPIINKFKSDAMSDLMI
ncbi:hypothetical protein A359_04010 [secondary endosymbiont of Ctenarytaina eucalypti]|uniref:Uncharacterized protein n=1 Tax=secondary endosymbiont of Ctenarytaina eucalypti TaxID=1199245 RepID=J3Z3I0_9ENTR|nr:hypothetical protein A359_04010 [secondary endosymbiont of Ctenarytaina eucalypti]